MKQRLNAPFGYRVENGIIIVNEVEAVVVQEIYRLYLEGLSYNKIAAVMEVPYIDGKAWNKNMVARILENKRYYGEKKYPIIVSREVFDEASAIKKNKDTRKARTIPEMAKLLSGRIICERCGQWYHRLHDTRTSPKWVCGADCSTTLHITDEMLEQSIVNGLNRLINTPSLINEPAVGAQVHSLEITRLNNELNRELMKSELDEETAVARIFELAAKRYELCSDGSEQHESEKLRNLFSQLKPIQSFDGELFEKAVRRLLISGTGNISLQLKNGQILFPDNIGSRAYERNVTTGGRNPAPEASRRAEEDQTETA